MKFTPMNRICAVCAGQFLALHFRAKYCGIPCQQRAYKQRKRDRDRGAT